MLLLRGCRSAIVEIQRRQKKEVNKKIRSIWSRSPLANRESDVSHPHSMPTSLGGGKKKKLKTSLSGVTGGYLQKHLLFLLFFFLFCVCVLSDCRRLWSVHRHSGMGCRVSGEWQTDRLTASEVVSGGFLLRRCRWVNYQGLWCALGCARDLYKEFFFLVFKWVGVFFCWFFCERFISCLPFFLIITHQSLSSPSTVMDRLK